MGLSSASLLAPVLAAAGAIELAWAARRRDLAFRPGPAHVAAVVVLLAGIALSAAASDTAWRTVASWLALPVIAWSVADLAARARGSRPILAAVSAALAALAGAALIAWATGLQELRPLTVDGSGRLTWPFEHPNNLGWTCALGLVFAIVGALTGSGWRERAAYTAAVALGGAALLATLSRTAWLALLVALVVVAVAGIARRLLLAGLAVLVLASLPVTLPRFTSPDAGADNVRLSIWEEAWRIFLEHPLAGIGLGRFDLYATPIPAPEGLRPPPHAHEVVLTFAAEAGVLGGLGVVAILAVAAADAWRGARRSGPVMRPAAAAAAGAVAALLVVGALDDPLTGPRTRIVIWMLLGLVAGLAAAVTTTRAATRGRGPREPSAPRPHGTRGVPTGRAS